MAAAATTPSRSSWSSSRRGYYADPKSPIASTPQQRRAGRAYPTTPSMATLSPMRHSETVRARRADETGAAGDVPAGRTGGLFSPTAHFDDGPEADKENEAAVAGATASATSTGGTSSSSCSLASVSGAGTATPVLAAAPPGRAAAGASSSARDAEAHPGEMSTAMTAAAAADLADRVSAAQRAIEATDDWESYEEYNPYLFIRVLPPYNTVRPRSRRIALPAKARAAPPISLVLDLDETLVHCSVEPIPDADLQFPVVFGGATYQVYVRKRPFLRRFLARVADKFEVTVFTASQSVYASRLLDLIDPEHKFIKHRLYRESCLNVDGNFIKDLNVLGRDLKQTVLVDNSQHAFGYQLDNGIPIESWFEDPDDRELLKLAWFLERELLGCDDVRPIVRRKFRMRALVDRR